jgi:hypothetical protein
MRIKLQFIVNIAGGTMLSAQALTSNSCVKSPAKFHESAL